MSSPSYSSLRRRLRPQRWQKNSTISTNNHKSLQSHHEHRQRINHSVLVTPSPLLQGSPKFSSTRSLFSSSSSSTTISLNGKATKTHCNNLSSCHYLRYLNGNIRNNHSKNIDKTTTKEKNNNAYKKQQRQRQNQKQQQQRHFPYIHTRKQKKQSSESFHNLEKRSLDFLQIQKKKDQHQQQYYSVRQCQDILSLIQDWGTTFWSSSVVNEHKKKYRFKPPPTSSAGSRQKDEEEEEEGLYYIRRGSMLTDELIRLLIHQRTREYTASSIANSSSPSNTSSSSSSPPPLQKKSTSSSLAEACSTVMGGHAQAFSYQHCVKAQSLMQLMTSLNEDYPVNSIISPPLNNFAYNTLLSAWSKCPLHELEEKQDQDKEGDEALEKMKDLLEYMKTNSNEATKPCIISYNTLLHAYARRGLTSSALQLLKELETLPEHDDDNNNKLWKNNCRPDSFSYTSCMNSLLAQEDEDDIINQNGDNKNNISKGEQAEELLHRMMDQYEITQNKMLRPTAVTFGIVIALHARRGRYIATTKNLQQSKNHSNMDKQRKTNKKQQREQQQQQQQQGYNPSTVQANANTKQNLKEMFLGARNAERVLNWMISLYHDEQQKHLKNNNNNNHNKNAKSNNRNNKSNTTAALQLNSSYKPRLAFFVTVLDAWGKCAGGNKEAAFRAEQLLKKMELLYEEDGNVDARPNIQCFVIVIQALAKSRQRGTAQRAEEILKRMEDLFLNSDNTREKLNDYAYNLVIDAWSRSREKGAAQNAERILARMNDLYNASNNEKLKPNAISYTNVIRAWVNSGEPGSADKAEKVLSLMERESMQDTIAYGSVIDAIAKSGEVNAAQRAEDILRRMQEQHRAGVLRVQPNTICFNSVINAWSKSSENCSAERAESILQEMTKLYNETGDRNAKPNFVTFSTCLKCYVKSSDVDKLERAEALFSDMKHRYENGDVDCKPHRMTFGTLISVVAASKVADKAKKAHDFFLQMRGMGIEPDTVTLNVLLKACASEVGDDKQKSDALKIAISTFNELKTKGLKMESLTYTYLLFVCKNLISNDQGRNRALEDVFQKCCEDGRVNEQIIKILQDSLSEPLFRSLLGYNASDGKSIDMNRLPSHWSRSCK